MPHVDPAGLCMKDAASFMVEELYAMPIVFWSEITAPSLRFVTVVPSTRAPADG